MIEGGLGMEGRGRREGREKERRGWNGKGDGEGGRRVRERDEREWTRPSSGGNRRPCPCDVLHWTDNKLT